MSLFVYFRTRRYFVVLVVVVGDDVDHHHHTPSCSIQTGRENNVNKHHHDVVITNKVSTHTSSGIVWSDVVVVLTHSLSLRGLSQGFPVLFSKHFSLFLIISSRNVYNTICLVTLAWLSLMITMWWLSQLYNSIEYLKEQLIWITLKIYWMMSMWLSLLNVCPTLLDVSNISYSTFLCWMFV